MDIHLSQYSCHPPNTSLGPPKVRLHTSMNHNAIETEVIGLCICLEAVNNIVNNILVDVRPLSKRPEQSVVYFNSYAEKELFLIRFLDFSKEGGDSRLTGVSGSCLNVLKSVCSTAGFNKNESVNELKSAVDELEIWLNTKSSIKLWLPTLEINAEVEVSRLDFLKISGNQCKHNLSRLTGVSRDISDILERHDYSVPIEHIPLALEDFQEHLQENYFVYYGTWITELLNNIRWGIQTYLLPIFHESYIKGDDGFSYHYEYPKNIHNDIPKQWFWRLMNNIRTGPYINRFNTPEGFKDQSSLEWKE